MSYRNLSVQAMVGVSGAWIDPNGERALFESRALLRPFLSELEKAHSDLIHIQVTNSSVVEELKKLTRQATDLDDLHDRKVRGIYGALTAFSELADEEAQAAELLELRDHLFPKGLSTIRRTYLDESGEVVLARGRLNDGMRAKLSSLPVPDGTLDDQVEAWFVAGQELGDVERKRVQLSNDSDEATISRGDVSNARYQWIRIVNTIVSVLDLIPDLEESTLIRIMQPRCQRRGRRGYRR